MIIGTMKKRGLLFILACLMLLSAVTFSGTVQEATASTQTQIRVDGETVRLPGSVFYREGRMYVPVAPIAEQFGAAVSWDSKDEELTVQTVVKDKIILGNGVPVVYLNEERLVMEAAPILSNGRLYAPLRQLTELLHGQMHYDAEADVALLTRLKAVELTEEDSLDAISKAYGLTRQELLKRNDLTGTSDPKPGTILKVVVPSFWDQRAKPFTETEYRLLAKITMVEAGYESYEGQLAIANVILNRVAHRQFPDSIRDVIYAGKQFPPAHNGLLDKSKPHASALRAAKDALNGKNNVPGAVYFHNPDVTRGSFWSGLTTVTTIGNHRFAK